METTGHMSITSIFKLPISPEQHKLNRYSLRGLNSTHILNQMKEEVLIQEDNYQSALAHPWCELWQEEHSGIRTFKHCTLELVETSHVLLPFSTRNFAEGPCGTLDTLHVCDTTPLETSKKPAMYTYHMNKSFFFLISKKIHFVQFFISHICLQTNFHLRAHKCATLAYLVNDWQFVLPIHFGVCRDKLDCTYMYATISFRQWQ